MTSRFEPLRKARTSNRERPPNIRTTRKDTIVHPGLRGWARICVHLCLSVVRNWMTGSRIGLVPLVQTDRTGDTEIAEVAQRARSDSGSAPCPRIGPSVSSVSRVWFGTRIASCSDSLPTDEGQERSSPVKRRRIGDGARQRGEGRAAGAALKRSARATDTGHPQGGGRSKR